MTKTYSGITALAMIIWAQAGFGLVPPAQKCDSLRYKAWKVYTTCENAMLSKEAKSFYVYVDLWKGLWRCRHTYFKTWAKFQNDASLAGSECVGSRFSDNGDQTVTDNLTLLVWEKKTALDEIANLADPHDADNTYSLGTGVPYKETGTIFTSFLPSLNGGGGFAGSNGWRLPTMIELQTLLIDHVCTGPGGGVTCQCSGPCVDTSLDGANTQPSAYWTATTKIDSANLAWWINFAMGFTSHNSKTDNHYARAIRGGL